MFAMAMTWLMVFFLGCQSEAPECTEYPLWLW